jgi:hypothetical protein
MTVSPEEIKKDLKARNCVPISEARRRLFGSIAKRTRLGFKSDRVRNGLRSTSLAYSNSEPAVGIEPTTARLRIECSTTELRWRSSRCSVSCPGADSNRDALRHHPLKMACLPISPPGPAVPCIPSLHFPPLPLHFLPCNTLLRTGLTGLEPATSGVTDRHSNQLSYSPK